MRCPTVAIVSPTSPYGFVVINESDLKPFHTLWIEGMSDKLKVIPALEAPAEASEPPDAIGAPGNGELSVHVASLRVSKGPRGKFYVKNGKEYVNGPFETLEMAMDAVNEKQH